MPVSPGERVAVSPSGVLTGDDPYRAAAPGTAHLTVSRSPSCSPGQLCPGYVVLIGRAVVTVTG
ncbi:MAG: hypothetical protein ACYDAQ_18745 [Mycobacteriales bacterium]